MSPEVRRGGSDARTLGDRPTRATGRKTGGKGLAACSGLLQSQSSAVLMGYARLLGRLRNTHPDTQAAAGRGRGGHGGDVRSGTAKVYAETAKLVASDGDVEPPDLAALLANYGLSCQ